MLIRLEMFLILNACKRHVCSGCSGSAAWQAVSQKFYSDTRDEGGGLNPLRRMDAAALVGFPEGNVDMRLAVALDTPLVAGLAGVLGIRPAKPIFARGEDGVMMPG